MAAPLYAAKEASGRMVVHHERFEVEQYVRVHLGNNRTEIGVVSGIDEDQDQVTVTTRQGYDVTVRTSAVTRAFLLVLDLNGVLVARGRGTCIHRPHVAEFVKFVFNNFVVAVWTSGLERSSNPIIDSVLDGYQDRLLFTLYRESCMPCPTPENPYGTIKNLQRIFDDYPKSFHSVNTIIIDDSPDKCSHPDVALCPVPFKDPVAQSNDDGLAKAMEVLNEVLLLDSHIPLIRAAEERLSALHEQVTHAVEVPSSLVETAGTIDQLPEVSLWKTRLCCNHTRGSCQFGDQCGYSHDPDNGRTPCSLKNRCRHGHASRWVTTEINAPAPKKKMHQHGQPSRQHEQTSRQHEQPPREQKGQKKPEQQRAKPKPRSQARPDANLYWTVEEERDAMREMKSHTGIPHLDREIEAAATVAGESAGRSGGGGNALSIFSTNSYARGGPVGSQPHHQPGSTLTVMERLQQERSRFGGDQEHMATPGAVVAQRQRGMGNHSANTPQPSVKFTNSESTEARSASSATMSVHLAGNSRDGTALLRQLERITRNS